MKKYPGETIWTSNYDMFSVSEDFPGEVFCEGYSSFMKEIDHTISDEEFIQLKTEFFVKNVHQLVALPDNTIKYDFAVYDDHYDAIIGQWCGYKKQFQTRKEMETLVGIAYCSEKSNKQRFSKLVDKFMADAKKELKTYGQKKECVCEKLAATIASGKWYAQENVDDMLLICKRSEIVDDKLNYQLESISFSGNTNTVKVKYCPICGRKL